MRSDIGFFWRSFLFSENSRFWSQRRAGCWNFSITNPQLEHVTVIVKCIGLSFRFIVLRNWLLKRDR